MPLYIYYIDMTVPPVGRAMTGSERFGLAIGYF